MGRRKERKTFFVWQAVLQGSAECKVKRRRMDGTPVLYQRPSVFNAEQ